MERNLTKLSEMIIPGLGLVAVLEQLRTLPPAEYDEECEENEVFFCSVPGRGKFIFATFLDAFWAKTWIATRITETRYEHLKNQHITLYTALRCPEYGLVHLVKQKRFSKSVAMITVTSEEVPEEFLPNPCCYLTPVD